MKKPYTKPELFEIGSAPAVGFVVQAQEIEVGQIIKVTGNDVPQSVEGISFGRGFVIFDLCDVYGKMSEFSCQPEAKVMLWSK